MKQYIPYPIFRTSFLIILMIFFINHHGESQSSNSDLSQLISQLKQDPRGPYKDIRWFCPDGTTLPPKERCKQSGGIQRARYKDEIIKLGNEQQVYLGQILSGTDQSVFYDQANNHSRMKQYLLEKYLYSKDDGWIQQKSKFYRGAIQDEDENDWGKNFLEWSMENDRFNEENFYLVREMVKHLPSGETNNTITKVRDLSRNIADRTPSFMDIRTKIHGNPQQSDIKSVQNYLDKNKSKLSSTDINELNELITQMNKVFEIPLEQLLKNKITRIKSNSETKKALNEYLELPIKDLSIREKLIRSADLLSLIKKQILSNIASSERLVWMEISILIEQDVFTFLPAWEDKTLGSQLEKTCYLSQISNSTGYIFDWEYDQLTGIYSNIGVDKVKFEELHAFYRALLRNISWGSNIVTTEFGQEVNKFMTFEPLIEGFMDDRIRSSALLFLGQQASSINDFIIEKAGWKNVVFGENSSSIQGINPGFAKGSLKVLEQVPEGDLDPKSIYVFRKSPSDLEPVAGILSVSEGNLVSHLQLLARNLGIPNANITEELFNNLKKHDGEEVFYAVSNGGGLILKRSRDMEQEEVNLFAVKKIDEEIVKVPTDELDLKQNRVFSISEVDASSSGILCGPKAANFGKLKRIFPDQLVDGLVVPFAVFRDHMEQIIPGQEISYWGFLETTFAQIDQYGNEKKDDVFIETYTLNRLSQLREFIKVMPLKETFITDLERQFIKEFKKPIGGIPVFLRSDTNMEDLKDFTGAGLNLTIFNTIDKAKIIQGIKDVWASPYTERSYRWRQKFLTNPEDVYPSILIIPSVFVDYSGVIITKDFIEGFPNRLNVAFSQGAGGAVDGQKSESWILSPDGVNILVSPARDRIFKYLSKVGGTSNGMTSLSDRILTPENISDIWKVIAQINVEMPKAGMLSPYDIELGFEGNKLWLFQIRPFVENKKAVSSGYLSKLDPIMPQQMEIKLNEIL